MKKIIYILIFICVAVSIVCACDPGRIVFVQISDTQIGFRDESENFAVSDSLMKDAVAAINRIKPDFVVVTGDLVNRRKDEQEKAIFKSNMALLDSDIPVYILPGNHDIGTYSQENLELYEQFIGEDHFVFKKGNCLFLGFDSCPIKDGATQQEERQYEWMEKELSAASDCTHKYLFMHCPIIKKNIDEDEDYSNFSIPMRKKYLSLCKKYGVEAVFSGHTHVDYYLEHDGTKLIVAGPVCKPLGNGFSGILVGEIKDDILSYKFVPAKKILDNFKK